MSNRFDAAVVIGRFQPFHNGHMALVQEALRVAPRVMVVLGSARSARTPRNPWTHEERAAMIRDALNPAEQARVEFVPMRDYFDEPRWRRNLVAKLNELVGPDARIAVVGHFKDSSSEYLKGFEHWGLVKLPLQGEVHATNLREAYFLGQSSTTEGTSAAIGDGQGQMPESTRRALAAFAKTPQFVELASELRALKAYHFAWQSAPYPPVFVTVDAVVTCCGHVLLIQRGKAPGKGLWAVPGGFLELQETLHQSALRELREETGLELSATSAIPLASHVFDHPNRSQRGRTISHGFHFRLDTPRPPLLAAADDAAALAWVPISDLVEREEEFFDDHFHLLDTFLKVLVD